MWVGSPGGGNGNLLQYSPLGNPMGRGAWLAKVHEVTTGQIWLPADTQAHTHTHRCTHTHTHTHGHTHTELFTFRSIMSASLIATGLPPYEWTSCLLNRLSGFLISSVEKGGQDMVQIQCSQGKHHFFEVSISHGFVSNCWKVPLSRKLRQVW